MNASNDAENFQLKAIAELAELHSLFAAIETNCGCQVSACARGLEGPPAGYEFGVGEERVFESASLIKVLVLAELLRQADVGIVSLQERMPVRGKDVIEYSDMVQRERTTGALTVKRLAEGMISESDNTATNLLISRVGKDRINTLAHSLHLENTILARDMMDFDARSRGEHNLTSASDMVTLLTAIWEDRFLSVEARKFALDTLKKQKQISNISGAATRHTLRAQGRRVGRARARCRRGALARPFFRAGGSGTRKPGLCQSTDQTRNVPDLRGLL